MNKEHEFQSDMKEDIFSLTLTDDWSVQIELAPLPLGIALALIVLIWVGLRLFLNRSGTDFEIEGAELGLGDHKISFKPNDTDRQIAYSIWVELSTRKIGLPIDLEQDTILEVYDSWYSFFAITRELIKEIPASKFQNESTADSAAKRNARRI